MQAGTILVTGGSGGLGRELVRALVEAGYGVAFTYASNREAAQQIEAQSEGRARAFPLDLSDRERPDELVRQVGEELGPIAGLVNNAGIRREALLAMTPDRDWDAVLDVNLGGAFRCCRAVVPYMVRQRAGSIVNVASLSAIRGLPGQAAYAASKAGLLGLTRSLAREIGSRGVRVNAVVPGLIETALTADLDATQLQRLRAAECLPDGVKARSAADTILFLLSDRAASITGQAWAVDAGSSA